VHIPNYFIYLICFYIGFVFISLIMIPIKLEKIKNQFNQFLLYKLDSISSDLERNRIKNQYLTKGIIDDFKLDQTILKNVHFENKFLEACEKIDKIINILEKLGYWKEKENESK